MSTNDEIKSSEVKIERATEILWKIIWFCFYMILFPLACSVLVSYISGFLVLQIKGEDPHFVWAFTILSLMFSLFFFYIGFDRYRNKPFFKNKENNLSARVHIPFLVSIASVSITPVIELITSEGQTGKFGILPLISFVIIYNIVWFYFYFKPIDVFNYITGEFEHFKEPISIFTALYNIVIIINYVLQIVFLAFVSFTLFSWIFILVTNICFYLFLFFYTKNIRAIVVDAMQEGRQFKKEILEFKYKYVNTFITLIFCLLIQLVILYAIYNSTLLHFTVSDLLVVIFIVLVVVMIFLKVLFYSYFYYSPEVEVESTKEVKKA